MPEITSPPEAEEVAKLSGEAENDFSPVCVEVPRIYDSCGAKDCLRNLNVFFTAEDQATVNNATAVRVTKASVLTTVVNVDSVAFNRGCYAVDAVFYFAVCAEVYTGTSSQPTVLNGLATYSKRSVLYGSDGSVKTFSSASADEAIDSSDFNCCPGCNGTLPTATVQVSCPITLASQLSPVTAPVIVPFVPDNVAEFFGDELVAPASQQVTVTLGIFSITQLTRSVQLMIPSYDFCVPRKECTAQTDDPCEVFGKIEFPTDSFFPPSAGCSDGNDAPPFGCACE